MAGLSAEEIQNFIDKLHMEMGEPPTFKIEEISPGKGRIRLLFREGFLRLGGTVSGPSIMRLVDASVYMVILGTIGPVWQTVTTNLNINFLRPASPGDVVAQVELLKVGRKLAFADFKVYGWGDKRPVAHGTCTYALPEPSIPIDESILED